jgi:hypothetical protein
MCKCGKQVGDFANLVNDLLITEKVEVKRPPPKNNSTTP